MAHAPAALPLVQGNAKRRDAAVPSSEQTSEHLFAALDGRDLNVHGHAWHLEVYAICEQAGRRWIQVAIDGPQHYMLTIALAADFGVRQALGAVSGWLANPTDVHGVLTVT